MLKVDTSDLKKLERHLQTMKSKALPFATQQTLNDLAFKSQGEWRKTLPQRLTLRSKYTEQSIQVEKSKGLDISRQQSVVGSVADYMDEQEHGATLPKEGKHGVPVPAKPLGRRRMPKPNQMAAIKLMPRVRGHRSRQVAASLSMAKRRGAPQYAFLRLRKGKQGIYRLDPSKKRAAVRKVWSLSKTSVTVPKNPTMQPAAEMAAKMRDEFYRKALTFQLKRHGLFGY